MILQPAGDGRARGVPDAVRHSKAMRSIADHALRRAGTVGFVMRGLDPRIHSSSQKSFEKGWIAGSSRQ
jgi:hypothetical protein